jgi:UDPglucose 6-dehydrogenase
MKIGIVGQGYVGTAVKEVFSKHYDVETYDLDKDKCSVDYLEDLVELSNIIFVCVPTPMKKDGSCDTSIVEAVVKDINDMVVSRNVSGRRIRIES